MTDHPTDVWPRIRLRHHPDDSGSGESGRGGGGVRSGDETRLSLVDHTHLAEPTVVTPQVARQVPERTVPPPRVRPPAGTGYVRGGYVQGATPLPGETLQAVAEQVAANRIRRIGPGGLFGWKPASGPSVVEVAAARRKIAEEEERRKLKHLRHIDALEIVRAYLGVFALVLLIALVAFMGYLAFGLLVGWYAWKPTAIG